MLPTKPTICELLPKTITASPPASAAFFATSDFNADFHRAKSLNVSLWDYPVLPGNSENLPLKR
jgi:hypothetical protein